MSLYILMLSAMAPMLLSSTPSTPWMDATLPIPTRVSLLMDHMTLTERARQTYAFHNIPMFKDALKADLGSTSFGSLKLSGVTTQLAGVQVALRNELQAFVLNASRLSIPLSWHNEVLVSAAPQATQFPLPVTLGASWNETLLTAVHEVIAHETRATGADVGYAPEVNLYSDGRFGRLQEGFSEDPLLTARLGVAAVLGLQGDSGSGPGTPLPTGGTRVAALAKHYLAYGRAAGGQNVGATDMTERTLREVYVAPWRAMIKRAGLRGLMPSHQTIFDVPVHGNAWTGQTLLRDELAWPLGLSVSDCSDVGALIQWGLAANGTEAAALGLEAGVDMDNMCSTNADGKWTYQHIEEAVAAGLVSERRVNESCSRVLAQKFAAGLFETPMTHETNESLAALLDCSAHRRLALEAAEQGIVLLLNRNHTLPLSSSSLSGNIALIGETSSCTFDSGSPGFFESIPDPFHCGAQLNQLGKPQHNAGNVSIITVGAALAATGLKVSGTLLGAHIDKPTPEADKAAAEALAKRSSIALLVMGDSTKSCGEWGDRDSLSLPGDQPEVLRRVLETGVPTILLLVHGRPVSFATDPSANPAGYASLLDYPNLVVVAAGWRSGEEGGTAFVNMLLGTMVTGGGGPSGRLAQAWPRGVGQIGGPSSPWYQQRNGKWIANRKGPVDPTDGLYHYDPYVDAPSTPLFPFGFGLSFAASSDGTSAAKYDASSASAAVSGIGAEAVVDVSVVVKNVGAVPAAEVMMVFVTAPLDNVVRYWKRLAGFTKVVLLPAAAGDDGSKVTVRVLVDDLAVFTTATPGSPSAGKRTVLKGEYTVSIGGSSATDVVKTTFTL